VNQGRFRPIHDVRYDTKNYNPFPKKENFLSTAKQKAQQQTYEPTASSLITEQCDGVEKTLALTMCP